MRKFDGALQEIGLRIKSTIFPHSDEEARASRLVIDQEMTEVRVIQERLIRHTSTHPISELPSDIRALHQRFSSETTSEIADKEIDLESGGKIICISSNDAVDQVICLGKSEKTVWDKDTRRIAHYYYIDQESGKYYDVQNLWSDIENETGRKVIPIWTSKMITPQVLASTKDGIYVVLNSMNLTSRKMNYNRHIIPTIPSIESIVPSHEAAHTIQLPESKLSPWLAKLMNSTIRNIVFIFSIFGNPQILRFAQFSRGINRLYERNAHAFALNMIRTLKKQGLDLARGSTTDELIYAVNTALSTYDSTYNFMNIRGEPFRKTKKRVLDW